ncbi:hypothetical protein P389DRAFT_210537 [Cystobasidium minutum MCA 4210]|uniref:uncharacterized protein n=1 Tax=Cystobasidium minutum MCA 4210 TaxID=1397322 RepID=UPI0034D002EE|eukprot:jgi/Rhomi1/210537/estExt_Genemark1.C_4_t10079
MAKGKDTGDAYEDIFGGGSDLSDVEDDGPVDQSQDLGNAYDDGSDTGEMSAAAEAEAVMAEDLGDDEDHEDGDYRQAEAAETNKLPSFKKDPSAKSRDSTAGEQPKKRKKKVQLDDADLPPMPAPLDPAAERAARLEAILSNKKKKAPRKRKPGEEDLDEMADEEVYRLRQAMDAAVEADKLAIEEQRPAIEKLKMLNEVIAVLQKPHLETTILEADILTQIRRWLEPIGKNLPAVNIQRELLSALTKMEIETSQLKASELGKIVYAYARSRKIEAGVKRLADQLVMQWMRPIVRRSALARDRVIQRAEAERDTTRRPAARPKGNTKTTAERQEITRRHASIPEAVSAGYTIAPIPKIGNDPSTLPKSNSRFKTMKARLDSSKQDSRRM